MKKTILVGFLLYMLPLVAGAQAGASPAPSGVGPPTLSYFSGLLNAVGGLVNAAIPILIGIALIFFFYGLVQYIRKPGGGGEHGGTDGKKIMIAGIVGLFVMVSVWGIIRLAQNIFNIQSNREAGQNIQSPRIPQ